MSLPAFYADAPRITMRDPLAEFLGAAEGGLMEYSYADAVRLAGHSCPTVAGAWLMARAALRALYPDGPAERGAVSVTMNAPEDEGTTGVIAQIFTLVTGATVRNGFHGIGGRFGRAGLMDHEGKDASSIAHFRRRDTGATVSVSMDVSKVHPAPEMRALLGRAMDPAASAEDRAAFAQVWQERVKRLLLDHAEDVPVIRAV